MGCVAAHEHWAAAVSIDDPMADREEGRPAQVGGHCSWWSQPIHDALELGEGGSLLGGQEAVL
jgi:hypothetical protein